MSLFKLEISKVTRRGSHLFGTATDILFNGEGVYGLTSDGVLQSKFFYNLNVKNDREGVVRVEANDGATSIQSSINESFLYKFITLSVYKDAVSSSATEEYTILSKNICLAYNCEMGAIVYIRQGVKLKRIITDESIEDILLETMLPWPGGITIIEAYTGTTDDTLVRMRFDDQIDVTTISGQNALHTVLLCLVNGVSQNLTSSIYFASLGGEYISFFLPTAVVYGDVITITYDHSAGGGLGWSDGGSLYLEDFALYPVVNNADELTTTTTSTSSTSSTTSTTSTSSTSTSSTSTSSTSTSSTSTSSTSSTSTSTTSTSSTSSTTTTTTTLDDEEIWTDGVDTFRFIARDSHACLDQTMTATGFSGTQGVDWDNIWEKTGIPSNALLNEDGYPLLNEDGSFMLSD